MRETFTYSVNNKNYNVNIVRKHIKNINFSMKNGEFYISCNNFVRKIDILLGLDKFAEKMIQRSINKNEAITENSIYLLGNKYELTKSNQLIFGSTIVEFKDKDDLNRKLKKAFTRHIVSRVRHFEKVMNVPEYKVRTQKMSTRFGSNSRHTNTLNFSMDLQHYSPNIIDSVVVHELAHYYEFNHSKNFYNVVYKYCPNYDYLHNCLRKGIYHD